MTPIVPEHRPGLSRRTVLAGAAGLAGLGLLSLSGCSPARSNPTIPEAAATGDDVLEEKRIPHQVDVGSIGAGHRVQPERSPLSRTA